MVFLYELKKLAATPALWGFIMLCVAFNCFITITQESGAGYPNFVSSVGKTAGTTLDRSFQEMLAAFPDDADGFKAALQTETADARDVFENYDIIEIGERYIGVHNADGKIAEIFRNKYADMQTHVDSLAAADESMSLYFGGGTYYLHQSLFGDVFGRLLMESMLCASLLTLLLFGYERSHNTELTAYSSKTGRRLLLTKLSASITASIIAFGLLAIVSLGTYFTLNDFSGIWRSSVSSGFNKMHDLIAGMRPFTTWRSFTVLGYFLACTGISIGIVAAISLFSAAVGVFLRNTYVGFMIVVLFNALCVVAPIAFSGRTFIHYIFTLSPIYLWGLRIRWFTDGSADTLWKNFELLGLAASGVLFLILYLTANKHFARRDLS